MYLIDRDGTNLRQLTSGDETRATTPRWSPDGSTIIFRRLGLGSDTLVLVNADGTHERTLT